jgi:hypothetical protein
MTTHAVGLRVTPCLRVECRFWLGDDGWEGSADHPPITVHANSFEQAKSDMELAVGEYIEGLLNESKSASKEHAA